MLQYRHARTMSTRCAAVLVLLPMLLVSMSITGLTACGDSGSTTERSATTSAPSETVPSAPRPGQGHNAEEYKGAYADGNEICGVSNRKKVAEIVGSRSTRPEAIARALAKGYKPRLRKQAYRGCLAAVR
jgi:hypothetical protein